MKTKRISLLLVVFLLFLTACSSETTEYDDETSPVQTEYDVSDDITYYDDEEEPVIEDDEEEPVIENEEEYEDEDKSETETVIVTRTGEKYHRPYCQYVVSKDDTESIPLSHAEDRGLTACSKCY